MFLFTAFAARLALVAIVALTLLSMQSKSASALDLGVKLACASDYYAHCSQHSPSSPGVRTCMRAAGPSLSKRCVSALIGAGEVTQVEVDRRRAAKQTASK